MRKLILQMQVSVDGYVGRKGEGPGWQLWDWGDKSPWDDALFADFNAFFEAADTILLGRKTAEGYINHWIEFAEKHPRKLEFAFARRINQIRKVIFSQTLAKSLWPSAELAGRSSRKSTH
jgi:dihydrofolate reductase